MHVREAEVEGEARVTYTGGLAKWDRAVGGEKHGVIGKALHIQLMIMECLELRWVGG